MLIYLRAMKKFHLPFLFHTALDYFNFLYKEERFDCLFVLDMNRNYMTHLNVVSRHLGQSRNYYENLNRKIIFNDFIAIPS